MNDLQKKEFEILKEFINVCEKLNLKYYLVCGSALGAAKYQGFIPWDDDIDVALTRKDYEVFLEKGKALLPSWCFIQNYRTDPQFHLLGTKIRDSRTTFMEEMCEKLNINHGIFIDVFPLDGKWTTIGEYKKFIKKRKIFEGRRRVNLSYRRFSPGNLFALRTNYYYLMNRLFGMYGNTQKAIKNFDEYIATFDTEYSSVWCNHANSISEKEYAPKEQYGNGTKAVFEGLEVYIPEKYDEYLEQKYGDWRGDLPIEKQKGHHFYKILDIDNPYTKYI